MITHILSDDVARIPSFGEDSVLALPRGADGSSRPAAAKTGTTTDFRDNWTLGYTPDLVVGVWTGNADNEPMVDVSGIDGAAPIWHDFMEAALKGRPAHQFRQPEGLVEVEVCALSGLLPDHDCPHQTTELFLAGTEPVETCHMHQRIALDRATGLRATADTPPEQIVERIYTLLPAEAQSWALEQGIPQPPPALEPQAAAGSQLVARVAGEREGSLVIRSPDHGEVYRLDPGLPRAAQMIRLSARPGAGISLLEVTLMVDGQPVAWFETPPYEALWPLEPGVHLISAEGLEANGSRVMSEAVRITVRE
jgi:membrane carboxypeptidase/penicillin-binding protein PbpC